MASYIATSASRHTLTRRYRLLTPLISRFYGTPRPGKKAHQRCNDVGTLSWASLNAYNGICMFVFWVPESTILIPYQIYVQEFFYSSLLSPRGLPLGSRFCSAGTHCSSHPSNQVRDAIMERGPTHLSFGLDYARHLGFNEPIDYCTTGISKSYAGSRDQA